jgi:hypothetical protein
MDRATWAIKEIVRKKYILFSSGFIVWSILKLVFEYNN